jgi:hypothetical protein
MVLVDAGVWVAASEPKDRFHRESAAIVLDLENAVAAMDLTFYEIKTESIPRRKSQPSMASPPTTPLMSPRPAVTTGRWSAPI